MKVKNLTKELKKGICLFLTAAMVFTNTGMTTLASQALIAEETALAEETVPAEEAALAEETVPVEETVQTEEPQQEADTTETDAASTISAEEDITEETDKSLSEEPAIRTESSESVLTENDFTKEEPTKEQTNQESAENTSEEDMTETEEAETEETVSEQAETEILVSNSASGTYQENGNNITWTIDADGKLTVEGTGDFSDFESGNGAPWWQYREDIKSAEIKTTGMTNAFYMFYGCSNLESVDFSGCDMSNVTTVDGIFSGCSSLKTVDFSGCNMSNVTNISNIFSGCSNLEYVNFSNTDLSNVTKMQSVFAGCVNLKSVDFSNTNLDSVSTTVNMFSGCSNLTTVNFDNCNLSHVTHMTLMFNNCVNLVEFDWSNCNLSNVTDISNIFSGCSSLETVNFSNCDLSSVTTINSMSIDCSSLKTVNFSGADLRNVTSMAGMFSGYSSLKTVNFSGADLRNVTSMLHMFSDNSSLETVDFSGADLGNLESMQFMFSGTCIKSVNFKDCNMNNVDCSYMFFRCADLTNLDLSNFDTSGVTNMSGMFYYCSGLTSLDLSSFDTSNVTNMSGMFISCSSLTGLDLSSFDTSNVTNMGSMFHGCSGLTSLDLSSFDTSSVTNMGSMFKECGSLTGLNISSFDTSSVTDMSGMFIRCSNLPDLSHFDTSNVMDMSSMFHSCGDIPDLSHFDTSSVTDMSSMFYNCSDIPDLSHFDTSNVTNMHGMFYGCSMIPDLSHFDTSNVTDMSYMFYHCKTIESLDLSSFDTSSVTDMNSMFLECSSLTGLDLSSFDTSNVTNMRSMFSSCSSLTGLDLSSFDTSSVTGMTNMFRDCSSLTELDLSSFDTSSVTNMGYMFYNCNSLTGLDVSSFDTSSVTDMVSIFGNCNSLTGLDLSSFDLSNLSGATTSSIVLFCPALTAIYTPRNLKLSSRLPSGSDALGQEKWYDTAEVAEGEKKTAYTELPQNREDSILLIRGENPEIPLAREPHITVRKTKTAYLFNESIDTDDLTVTYYAADRTVNEVTDYTTNLNDIDMSEAGNKVLTVTYTPDGGETSFSESVTLTVTYPIEDAVTITLPNNMFVYDKKPQKPEPTVTYMVNGITKTLEEKTDYTLSYQNNKNAFDAESTAITDNAPTIIVKGRGLYSGTATKTFSIEKADAPLAEEMTVELSEYDAAVEGRTLSLSRNFVKYGEKTEYKLGTPVEDNTISDSMLSGTLSVNNKGILSYSTNKGTVGDFVTIPVTVSFENYQDAMLNVKIVFVEKSTTNQETVKITGIDINSRSYNGQEISYTGSAKAATEDGTDVTDEVTLTYTYSGTQADGSAYTATSSAPVNAGSYKLTVTVAKDNESYTGSAKYLFSIAKAPLTVTARDMGVKIGAPLPEPADYQYDTMGLLAEDYLTVPPTLTCNIASTETEGTYEIIPADADAGMNYEITYKNGTLIVSETGESAAYYAVTFDLLGKGNNITNTGVKEGSLLETPQVPIADGYTFTGWYKDEGCTVLWDFASDTIQADTTLYAGWKADSSIGDDDVDDSPYSDDERIDLKSVSAEIATIKDKVYDGNEYEPVVKVTAKDGTKKVTLTEGADYRVIYKNNTDASTDENKGTVIVKGNGIYKGQIEKTFTITKKPIKKLKISTGGVTTATTGSDLSTLPIYVYDGATLLVYNKDYTLSGYEVKKSTATVTVTATESSNYSGTTVAKLTIYEGGVDTKFILPENITLKPESNAKTEEAYAYTGKAVKPEVTVTVNGTALTTKQYKVQYLNNKDAGTAYVIVTGKGEYKGKIVVPFTIKAETVASQNDFAIKEIKEKTFNGKLQKPSVTVSITKNGKAKKLSKKDYTVAYKNNFHAGEATVTVTGKGNYAGLSATATFTIKPQQMKKAALKGTKDNLTLTYNKRKLKEGYDYEPPVYGTENKNKVEVTIKAKENGDFTGTMTKKIKVK